MRMREVLKFPYILSLSLSLYLSLPLSLSLFFLFLVLFSTLTNILFEFVKQSRED